MRKRRSKARRVIANIVTIAGLVLASYVGGWVMFIKPIIAACVAFDEGTLTAVASSITKTVSNVTGVVTDNAGDPAAGYTAEFNIQGTADVKGCKWFVTKQDSEKVLEAEALLNNGEGTTISDGSVIFGLVVTAASTDAFENVTVDAQLK